MSIAKPFIFIANTYAKSSEVNADFDVLYGQVNTNIANIAQNATDIDNLESNKANKSGSATQRFDVADPTTNTNAVNKQTLMKSIGNTVDFISGFTITRDSGSPEDTIIVSAGACYDSTKSIVLKLDSAVSKQNSSQTQNATYYVYVIGNDTGSQVNVAIDTSSSTPVYPSGYTKCRQIGYYTTDENSHIKDISFYGIDPTANRGVSSYLYETDWETFAASTNYTFDLSDEKISDIDPEYYCIYIVARAESNIGSGANMIESGSMLFTHYCNTTGGTSATNRGFGVKVYNKVLTVRTGATLDVSLSQGTDVTYANIKCKIIIVPIKED